MTKFTLATSRRVAVVATGTEVGKTHVACALLASLRSAGAPCVGLKPIESGLSPAHVSDAARLAEASASEVIEPLYGFVEAVSPHLAARREGRGIDVEACVRWARQRAAGWTVVETAGGLLSPLSPTATNLTLVEALQPDAVVVVAPDRLGVLHDVSAVMLALASIASRRRVIVVMSATADAEPDASMGTNAAEVVTLGICADVVSFPRANVAALKGPARAVLELCCE
jgi:dethiobiotin synthetase